MGFFEVTMGLMEGFVTTLELFAMTLLFALPLGLVISFGSMSKVTPLRWLTNTCVWIVRGTPLLLQVIVVYYVPGLVFDLPLLARPTAALLAFVVNYSFYFSEIYRSGIQSVPHGQQEAGQVLGMTSRQIFFKITLLQVVKRIVPPMANEMMTLLKDTALVRVIAVSEIIFVAENYMRYGYVWPLFYTAVFYLVFIGILTILLNRFEKKLDYFKA